MIGRPIAAPTATERVRNVAAVTVELLNGLKYRNYRIIEAGDRLVIESSALA